MDESTSNLDFATENIIFDMIYNKFRKKTMLIISHRLATVKNCDKIIVMDKGKIIEQEHIRNCWKRKGSIIDCGKCNREILLSGRMKAWISRMKQSWMMAK